MSSLRQRIVFAVLSIHQFALGYRYSMLDNSKVNDDLCTNQTCSDGEMHTACDAGLSAICCDGFELLRMNLKMVEGILNGHNGIRNRVALHWNIANMNILHWERELRNLAEAFVKRCQHRKKDVCDFLFEKTLTINQNMAYILRAPPRTKWHVKPIRSWFLSEKNAPMSMKKFMATYPNSNNFTQLIWPNTEFVGCAAGKMHDGYLFICYYNPAPNLTLLFNESFTIGRPCTKCVDGRPTCSRNFRGLCGLDIRPQVVDDRGVGIKLDLFLLVACSVLRMILTFLY